MRKCSFTLLISLVFSIFLISCNSDDDAPIGAEQFFIANVNGVAFTSDNTKAPLGFSRIIMPSGRINLHVKVLSAEGDMIEFMVENFQGSGKYHFGDNFYNKSWMKFESPQRAEAWGIEPGKVLHLNSNFIEIVSVRDDYIEGKIACSELINNLDGILGAMDGEFRLIYLR